MRKEELQTMSVSDLERLQTIVGDELERRRNIGKLHPGDKVKHRGGFFKEGTVEKVAKSGLRVMVEYEYTNSVGRRYSTASYFLISKLQKLN